MQIASNIPLKFILTSYSEKRQELCSYLISAQNEPREMLLPHSFYVQRNHKLSGSVVWCIQEARNEITPFQFSICFSFGRGSSFGQVVRIEGFYSFGELFGLWEGPEWWTCIVSKNLECINLVPGGSYSHTIKPFTWQSVPSSFEESKWDKERNFKSPRRKPFKMVSMAPLTLVYPGSQLAANQLSKTSNWKGSLTSK